MIAMHNYYAQNGKFCLQSKILCSLKQSIGQQRVTKALKWLSKKVTVCVNQLEAVLES